MSTQPTDLPRFDDTEDPGFDVTNMSESDADTLLKLVVEYDYPEILRTLALWLEIEKH